MNFFYDYYGVSILQKLNISGEVLAVLRLTAGLLVELGAELFGTGTPSNAQAP
jgi:hypothetical protein